MKSYIASFRFYSNIATMHNNFSNVLRPVTQARWSASCWRCCRQPTPGRRNRHNRGARQLAPQSRSSVPLLRAIPWLVSNLDLWQRRQSMCTQRCAACKTLPLLCSGVQQDCPAGLLPDLIGPKLLLLHPGSEIPAFFWLNTNNFCSCAVAADQQSACCAAR